MIETYVHPLQADAPAGKIWLALLPTIFVALMAFAVGAASAYAPPATGQLAVVFPPWVGEVEAFGLVAQAGGLIVGPSRFDNIVVAFAPDSGFAARIARLGALFTTQATGICGPAPTREAMQ
jgi:hypothetical protein